jgi:HK97 family phage major capsid protein
MAFRLAYDRTRAAAMASDGEDAAPESGGPLIPVVFSSEYGVERYDWWEGERYLEILDHAAEAVDLSRAVNGLPFLDTHSAGSVEDVLGRVENIVLRPDRTLAGMLRLSRRESAQAYRLDVEDGIAGEVSFGYKIDPSRVDVVTSEAGLPRYIIRAWQPFEVSAVPVPADPTVGLNRAANDPPPAHALRRPGLPAVAARADTDVSARSLVSTSDSRTAPPAQEPAHMEHSETLPTGGAPAAVVVTRSEGPTDETRRQTLAALAEKHAVSDVFSRGIAEGKSLDAISAAMVETIGTRVKAGPQFGAGIELTDRERKAYSIANAIICAQDETDGFERDVSQEIAKRLPQGYNPKGGIFIPTNLGVRAPIVGGTSSLGGAMVFTEPGSFIDLLRNMAAVVRAGATMLPGLSAPVSFPKQLTSGSGSWVAENPGSDVTETNMTFGLVTLTPKTFQATQAFSRQLLLQARNIGNAEQIVRNDLAAVHALAIDKAAIDGTGTSNQPLGLTKNTNVGTVAMGTNGGVPTYDAFVDLEVLVRTANVMGDIAAITTPGIAGKLKKTQVFATTNGVPVWGGSLINGVVNGAPAFATNQVPSNLTKGTATTVCHAVVAGAFENFYIGEFGAIEILTDPYAKKKQGLIEVTSFQMVDMAARYDNAFAVILDARTS